MEKNDYNCYCYCSECHGYVDVVCLPLHSLFDATREALMSFLVPSYSH